MLTLITVLSLTAQAGKPLGAGIAVRQVQPPATLVSGVPSLSVGRIQGPAGDDIRKQIIAGLEDAEREVGMGTAGDVAGKVLQTGAQIGGQMLASKVPVGGKVVATATETVGGLAAGAVEGDKVQLDDGLKVDVFQVKDSGGSGRIEATVKVQHADTDFEKEVEMRDSDGNLVKDENGIPLKTKVSCTRREVTSTLEWTLTAGGQTHASGKPSSTYGRERCAGEEALPSVDSMAEAAASGLGHQVPAEIMPAWKSFRIGMKKSKDVRVPLAQIKQGEHTSAMCMLSHLTEALPEDPVPALDLGAVHEALGHHDAAIAAYELAQSRKSTKMAGSGLERVQQRKADVAAMTDAYGLTWKIGAPDFTVCPKLPEGRLARAKKDAELTLSSGGTASVAKGDPLIVLAEDGGTVTVHLLDGTEGTLSAKLVK